MTALLFCLDCAAALYIDPTGEYVDAWGERTCSASYRPHLPDVPKAPTTNNKADGLRRAKSPVRPGLTGADCPASRTHAASGGPPSGRLLDPGHPATPVADGPCGQADTDTASRTSGPTTHLVKGIHR
jgi:hypothetical protein